MRTGRPVIAAFGRLLADPRALWRRAAAVLPHPVRTPFTFCYLVLLLGTTVVIRVVDPAIARRILSMASSDAHNLWHRPIVSLASSAFWLSEPYWLAYAVIFAFGVAPLERRVGAGWTAAVFASGHLFATLATELPVMWAITEHLLPRSDGRWLDIGASYGFFATTGVLLTTLRRSRRIPAIIGIHLAVVLFYLASDPASTGSVITLAGHLIAVQLGLFAWRPWLRRRGLVAADLRRRVLVPAVLATAPASTALGHVPGTQAVPAGRPGPRLAAPGLAAQEAPAG